MDPGFDRPLVQNPPLRSRPVTTTLSVLMVVILILYSVGYLKNFYCENNVINGLNRTFIHGSWDHILANILAFYALSRIEIKHGSGFFISLILQIAVLAALIEFVARKFIHLKCSVGFSGVLFGLLAWELVSKKSKVDKQVLYTLAIAIILPSLVSEKTSFSGHLIGAISGLLIGFANPKN